MKVYILLNKNAEGDNFIGVYSTRERAEGQMDLAVQNHREYLHELYRDDDDYDPNIDSMIEWECPNHIEEVEIDDYFIGRYEKPVYMSDPEWRSKCV